jgi:hypothetical protein
VVHHIACDHVAVGVIVHELATLYEAFAADRPSPLPEPDSSYDDYVDAQRRRVAAVGDGQLDYWRRQLAGASAGTLLPGQPVPRRSGPPQGEHRRFQLSADDNRRTRVSSRKREGVTLFMALLAAFQALLHRYRRQLTTCRSGPPCPLARRRQRGVVGCFLNTLVLRC